MNIEGNIRFYETDDFKELSIKSQYEWCQKTLNYILGNNYHCRSNNDEDNIYYQEHFNNISQIMILDLKDRYKEDEKIENTLEMTEFMFLTVNPPDEYNLKKSHEYVQSFCNKLHIKKYIYAIEQKGLTEETIHQPHFHILFTHDYTKKSLLLRETQSSFKKIFGDGVKNYHWVNLKHCATENDIRKRLYYILEDKKDLTKQTKQQIDKIFRKKKNLKDYYTNDFNYFSSYMDN